MSYYREVYLKSEHWQNLRLEKLALTRGECSVCGVHSVSNDVHHVTYLKSLWEIRPEHLRVLCRECHVLVHKTVDTYFSDSAKSPEQKWCEAYEMIIEDRYARRDDEETKRQGKRLKELNDLWTPFFSWCRSASRPWAVNFLIHAITGWEARQAAGFAKSIATTRIQRDAKITRILSGNRNKGDSAWLGRALRAKARENSK